MSKPRISPGDRLGMTLFMAAALHGAVLLGVGFTMPVGERDTPPLIEITLAQSPTDETPDDYDFLAPDDQDGGGTAEEAMRPAEPSSLLPDPRDMSDLVSAAPTQRPDPAADDTRTITTDDATAAVPEPEQNEPQPDHAPNRDLVDADEQVARDIADTSRSIDWNARYPSQQRINARTRAHDAAAYMQSWIERIEQVGNLNYPDEARRQGLSGRMIVEVTLEPDGSVAEVRLLERSPHQLLDESAKRVVELAGPFDAIPEDVLDGKDQLVITRTWEFVSDGELEAR
ncbi:energy transducer TonB [Aquisalimonas asiatica]|uniref:Outer membrane transport energization protein TonB n=1 Tax=Aquisalimonas asiatica TaxID=406100 RepID=A0A1H8TPG1_9GAMM|nr:energy transducer TonB [Aquisalimonas asiatica]SEO92940.1 outer membrane transport energization protein TonB [Aquisalimonas asiatica]